MPNYTIRNKETGEEYDVSCSHAELKEALENDSTLEQVMKFPGMISQSGSTIGKTSEDWRGFLKKIDKNAGRRSKVKNY